MTFSRHRHLKAATLPAALTFSMISALILAALLLSSIIGDNLLARLERKEQAASSFHAACLIYGRDSVAFDSIIVQPFANSDIRVMEKKSMHGLYGKLTLTTELWDKSNITQSYITGHTGLPLSVDGIYIPDNGTIVTLSDDCKIASPLFLPHGYFRALRFGRSEPDSLTVLCSQNEMPELSDNAKGILYHPWTKEPDVVILKGRNNVNDAIVWGRKVVIDSTYKGSIQTFARDSIVVTDGATLEYPSGICLVSDDERSGITVGANATIEGYVIILNKGSYKQEEGSLIRGLVYAPYKSEISGAVTGCAFLGNPCYENFRQGISEYTLAHLTQNRNRVLAYPELFAGQAKRTVIKRLEQ